LPPPPSAVLRLLYDICWYRTYFMLLRILAVPAGPAAPVGERFSGPNADNGFALLPGRGEGGLPPLPTSFPPDRVCIKVGLPGRFRAPVTPGGREDEVDRLRKGDPVAYRDVDRFRPLFRPHRHPDRLAVAKYGGGRSPARPRLSRCSRKEALCDPDGRPVQEDAHVA